MKQQNFNKIGFYKACLLKENMVYGTCRTIGSCSGGDRFSFPFTNQTWNAVSCSAKNEECSKAAEGSGDANNVGSWDKQLSNAKSQAAHIAC